MATRQVRAQGEDPRKMATAINEVMNGKINAYGSLTLTPSAAATTISDRLCGPNSVILLMAKTSTAASEIGGGTMYIGTRTEGSFVVSHANNSASDRSFVYVLLGG